MSGLGRSLALVALVVVAMWAVGRLLGFEVGLVSSLVLSLAATAVLTLGLRAFGRR